MEGYQNFQEKLDIKILILFILTKNKLMGDISLGGIKE